MPTRAAIYARQSRTGEGSESLELQVERCREAAQRHGLQVVAELVEPPSTSGYKNRGRDRAQFKQLIDLTRTGEVDCVVVYKTDGLSRGGGPGYAPLVDAIEGAGGDPGRFILADNSWVAEFELSIRAAMDREASALTAARMADMREREAIAGKARQGLHDALHLLETGSGSALVVAKLDRLSRNLLDFAALMKRSRQEDGRLYPSTSAWTQARRQAR